mmetsp:Transcript_17733/g.53385  ORF Transcript_17733/g.53385 Transcript_17733/m.53385 type:complete len:292 (-) Transcript_17733:1159-2034(-)
MVAGHHSGCIIRVCVLQGLVHLGVAPNFSTRRFFRTGSRISSSHGTPFSNSEARAAFSPMEPPRKMRTPSTALPSFLAGHPISPMSATWAWPQELGQPVQCMRMPGGMFSCASSFSTTSIALFLVSMRAMPQNWEPVQDTRPRDRGGASIWWVLKMASCLMASRRSSGMLGNTMFCSTVSRSVPSPYFSATSAQEWKSSAVIRPAGTQAPTQNMPLCFWGWMPSRSRLGKGVSYVTCTPLASGSPMRSAMASRNLSTPQASTSQMRRAFWRSVRSPWSLNTSSSALQYGTT